MRNAMTVPAAAVILSIVLALWRATPAMAVVTYDHVSDATLSFSHLWSDIAVNVSPSINSTSGTGVHTETILSFDSADVAQHTFYQSAQIIGSAGDPTHTGSSSARRDVYTLFTFDFGDIATDFAVTFLDYNHIHSRTTEFYGDRFLSGSLSTQLLVDGQGGPFLTIGVPNVFAGLTGVHTVRLLTGVEASVVSDPFATVPEPSSLMLITIALAIGGIGKRLFRHHSESITCADEE